MSSSRSSAKSGKSFPMKTSSKFAPRAKFVSESDFSKKLSTDREGKKRALHKKNNFRNGRLQNFIWLPSFLSLVSKEPENFRFSLLIIAHQSSRTFSACRKIPKFLALSAFLFSRAGKNSSVFRKVRENLGGAKNSGDSLSPSRSFFGQKHSFLPRALSTAHSRCMLQYWHENGKRERSGQN